MKRNIYIILCIIAVGLLGYTMYYILNSEKTPEVPVSPVVNEQATTTEIIASDTNIYTTKSGKKITLRETNPIGQSLSTLTITTEGFATNTPVILETNKLTNTFYADLNADSFEEMIITTMAQGSGSFGEVFLFTTASNTMLIPITIPEMTEDDSKKGSLFEGYMGHDSFTVLNNTLVRTFPTYMPTDTNDSPTGPTRSVIYTLNEKNGLYSTTFTKGTTTPFSTSTQSSQQ